MAYIQSFISLVKGLNPITDNFLGLGNPNSDILIIGKEAAIGANQPSKIREISKNISQWDANLSNPSLSIASIPSIECDCVKCWKGSNSDYNPLYPYKGVCNTYKGLGPTWYSYTKIIQGVYGNNHLSMFERAFITELSTVSAFSSSSANRIARKKSIVHRTKNILCQPFFKNFKIVILAIGKTPDYKIDIERIFDVHLRNHCVVSCNNHQWYDVYVNNDASQMLIHTRQMSNGFSNSLRNQIINEIIGSQLIP